MARTEAHTVSGRIAVVQEERFRLVTDSGQALLLTLAHNSWTSAADLCRWHENGEHVRIEYEGEPNLTSGVARAVRPIDSQP